MSLLCGLACSVTQGQPGDSIEWRTGSTTGNPFEIRLVSSGSELKAVLANRSSSEQVLLYHEYLQTSSIELVSSTGQQPNPKPYDSRLIMKVDSKPYCRLFQKLGPGKKLEIGTLSLRKSRDGYAGQWGPYNFDEVAAGDYHARVIWHSERSQCLDESTQQMRKLTSAWKGMVRSNQITVHLP